MSGPLRVLVACEYSGIVRDAFIRAGHYAMSCDLLPSESDLGDHYRGDVFDVLLDGWDLMVAHPPCTYLTNAANGSLYATSSSTGALVGPARWAALIEGATFFRALLNAPIPRIAIENPRMNGHAQKIVGRRRDQAIQPYQFGHMETKEVCLWLRGLPPLIAGEDVRAAMLQLPKSEYAKVHHTPPGADRSKERSRFFPGIADAMAQQWGGVMAAVGAA